MSNSNKILTVSYGNFSCTLEGFEDPFAMMKAITEYFRDLSIEDNQLGAELPQPSADQLKQFVESQGEHQIDASREGDALVLRASRIVYDTDDAKPAKDTVAELEQPETSTVEDLNSELPALDAREEAAEREKEELERRAKARLMALRKELDPLVAENTLADEDESSDPAGSKKDLLPEISMREESISRLLDEADNKIGGAESRRRSMSIAHLKAAVAASAADEGTRPERVRIREERQKDPYRKDLARAVGKSDELERRPAAESHPVAQAANPVPLMLVSNQRVSEDLEVVVEEEEIVTKAADAAMSSASPVQAYMPTTAPAQDFQADIVSPPAPTEVTEEADTPLPEDSETTTAEAEPVVSTPEPDAETVPEDLAEDATAEGTAAVGEPDEQSAEAELSEQETSAPPAVSSGSFGDFAASQNARALPELLEAAVAFAQRQSDQGEALRPQVMKLVAEHLGEAVYQRDEAMRVFGTLLREGRIEKLPKGRFTLPSGSALMNHA